MFKGEKFRISARKEMTSILMKNTKELWRKKILNLRESCKKPGLIEGNLDDIA
jgi:hypothetical protein